MDEPWRRKVLLALLQDGVEAPLTEDALLKRCAPKAADRKAALTAVAELLTEGLLRREEPARGAARLSVPGAALPKVLALRWDVPALRKVRFSASQLEAALAPFRHALQTPGAPPPAVAPPPGPVLDEAALPEAALAALRELANAAPPGGLVPLAALRAKLPAERAAQDRALLALARDGRLHLQKLNDARLADEATRSAALTHPITGAPLAFARLPEAP